MKKEKITKICKGCAEPFKTWPSRRTYCFECRPKKSDRVCAICGTPCNGTLCRPCFTKGHKGPVTRWRHNRRNKEDLKNV